MCIADGKLLYCHGFAEGNVEKSTLEYNNRTVYDCFNNPFTSDFGSPYLHLPPITIGDIPPPHKINRCTPDLLPDAISIASENYVSTLTTPYDSPDLLPADASTHIHIMKKILPFQGRFNRGYCCRKHSKIRCYKKTRLYCYTCSDENKKNIIATVFPRLVQRQGIYSWNISIFIVVFVSLPYFTLPVELILCLFSSFSIDHSL